MRMTSHDQSLYNWHLPWALGCLNSLGDMDIIPTRAADNKVRMFTQMTRSHITNVIKSQKTL